MVLRLCLSLQHQRALWSRNAQVAIVAIRPVTASNAIASAPLRMIEPFGDEPRAQRGEGCLTTSFPFLFIF